MASLNLSINGPSIKSSYQGVVNGPAPASSSSTYAQWALFSVQAPLMNAFQDSGSKESILKVQSTGEGELADLVEDFNEGRIQYAFVKVKDPNTALPKSVLIAWCGGGVPERTKGYFTSHTAAVAKILHGYHVQITARSDTDLTPESIVQKVSDASGAKYTAGGAAPLRSSGGGGGAPPPVAKKPVFTPTASSSSGAAFNPLVAARSRRQEDVDQDGWGSDAPPVTRTQLERVEPAYKPTKVNINDLMKNRDESRSNGAGAGASAAAAAAQSDASGDVVRGGYQPIGKVDIAAIRAQAKNNAHDDRPTIVRGAYEPVGKVDIAAIRARAQKPADDSETHAPAAASSAEREAAPPPPRSLAERSAAFTPSERLTELPKPKVAKKWGGASAFTGTKAPTPGGLGFGSGSPAIPSAAPVGAASRTFADQGGKTPAQLWAEKKARQSGSGGGSSPGMPPAASPVTAQKSGGAEWKSGYVGKTWAPVQTSNFGRGGVETHRTGATDEQSEQREQEQDQEDSPAGGISALRDRFKDAAPMGGAVAASRNVPQYAQEEEEEEERAAPPPPPMGSRPSGGFALPGLPSRPAAAHQEEEEEQQQQQQEEEEEEAPQSPIRVAMPVARGPEPEFEAPAERLPPRPIPMHEEEIEVPHEEELPREEETHDPRAAAALVAEQSLGHPAAQASSSGGKRALIQYDYEKAEDNEIELREGEYVTNIEMVDEDWWMGTNSIGESGLFPSNYVELVEDGDEGAGHAAAAAEQEHFHPQQELQLQQYEAEEHHYEHEAAGHDGGSGKVATAQFDYEAAEDNELSFPEGAKITDLEFPDEDWWFGHYGGASGLFPANYVQLDS